MRLDRLVIEAGERTLAADFHPRMTVVGGLGRPAREALASELLDSLAGARPGVHLEVTSRGRHLTVFRPAQGRHRVIDTTSVADVTGQYLADDGEIDLFAAHGVDRALGRSTVHFRRDDLILRGESDAWVAQLAAAPQEALWESAMRFRAAEALLERVSGDSGASIGDAPIVREIEARHAELVEATETYDRIRLIALTIATVGALTGLLSTQVDVGVSGLPFLAVAAVGVALALRFRWRVGRAASAERAVLADAGADDYSSFHFQRVSTLLDTDLERRRFMQAVSDHSRAAGAWESLAGAVPVAFALDHEREVRAAAELHAGVGSLRTLSTEAPQIDADTTAELAQVVLSRIDAVRALTGTADGLPLVVDDPFEGLDAALKPLLLEMLASRAGDPQLIVLTCDEEVLSWARMESMSGQLAVVEPTIANREAAQAAR